MHVFALGLGEAGLETSLLLSLRESQGRYKGGECLVSLCQGRVGGPLATWQLALDVCPGRGKDSYHSVQVEMRCLLSGPEALLPRKLFVVYTFSSSCSLYLPVSRTERGYCAFHALVVNLGPSRGWTSILKLRGPALERLK